LEELRIEKNDRGAAILASQFVENSLQLAIESRLNTIGDKHNLLFGFDSPVATFAAKIRIGAALEIFGQHTENNLLCIKAIRNCFAHANMPISFETTEVKDACETLKLREIVNSSLIYDLTDGIMAGYSGTVTKRKFVVVCNAMYLNFTMYMIMANNKITDAKPSSTPNYQDLMRPLPLP
jgi:hypothetical protein